MMLTTVALLLAALPGEARLANFVPRGVHLLDLAEAPPLLEAEVATDTPQSAAELRAEYEALRRSRPSLGAPITIVSIGAAASVLGLTYLLISTSVGLFVGAASPFLVLGLALLGVGMPAVVIGIWMLVNRIRERSHIDAELKALEGRLRQLERERQGPQPLPLTVQRPTPAVLVASF
jgi:hypothetical protein